MSAESPPLTLMSTKDAMIFHGFGLLPDGQTYLPIETDLSQPLERMFFHETMVSEEVEIETTEMSLDENNNESQNLHHQCPRRYSAQEEIEYQKIRNAIQALEQAASDPCLTQIQVAETGDSSDDLSQCILAISAANYTEIVDTKTQILIPTRNDDTVTEEIQESLTTHSFHNKEFDDVRGA